MKSNLKNLFQNRTIGFWLGMATAVIGLISAIYYIASNYGDVTFSMGAFVLMLVGSLSYVGVIFIDVPMVTLIPSVMFSVASGWQLYVSLPTITDILNGLVFFGGNQTAAVLFSILFPVCAILMVVTSFMKQRR